jgi:tryptophanyl-tRNA synthetase
MSKPVILTGLRANNDLHLGNYLGALLPMVDMAKQKAGEYQINLFIPDLHSFTTPIDHDKLQDGILNALKVFVAAGLPIDNPDVHIYRQSFVPAHSELTWILDCFTGMGEMQRMTQFKDKSSQLDYIRENATVVETNEPLTGMDATKEAIKQQAQRRISVGLFNYPVLMAADILLYGAEFVPVGDDQTQHLEFTREISFRMNKLFGSELFVVPKPVKDQHQFFGKDQGLRIRDLQNPTKKMSKSAESDKGVIFLTDSPDEARKKVMSAETDSHAEIQQNYNERPGISNLLDILTLLGGSSEDFIGQNQYGPLKTLVADKVADFLTDFQAQLSAVDEQAILDKLIKSETQMNALANQRLLSVQKAVGLRS